MKTEPVDSKNTKRPRGRRFEMWANIIGGLYLVAALVVVLFIPHQIRGDIFLPWFLILLSGAIYKNRQLNKIREEEQTR